MEVDAELFAPWRITREAIVHVARVIRPYIRTTPTIEIDGKEFGLGACSITLKLESLQHAGSFKTRGAFANLLSRQIPPCGVAAASGGNHGAAVAYAAMKLGVPARIFVPSIASRAKVERIREFKADLVIGGEAYADALLASQEWIEQSGALGVHAFDQVETLLGQATLGMEFERQIPELNAVLAPVGGGGLICGIAGWYRNTVKVIGVEPETSPTMTRALAAGGPVDVQVSGLAADSLAPRRVGDLVFPIAARYLSATLLVSDDDIRAAQKMLWNKVRLVAEPGGVAALAAVLSGKYDIQPDERIGVVISGANTVAVDFALQEKVNG